MEVLIMSIIPGVLLFMSGAALSYPSVLPPDDTSNYGKHFQRSMTLMAASMPEKRNIVRILYYGQSIVGQRWSDMVDADLRQRFPNTDFVTRNLAIGGFSSERLARTMHYDVFPFYPDLMIFHVYGSHIEYEKIIKEVRERTTAEIIIQTDHANKWPEPRADSFGEQEAWDAKMNYWILPQIAQNYNCALQPQRDEWTQYMRSHNLEPAQLLTDSVHLNEHGKWLMAELMKRFLILLPEEPQNEWKDMVKTYVVGKDVNWQNGKLTLEFEGNRVVALAGSGAGGSALVLIDGKRPGEFPECYTFTRPSGTKNIGWPAIMKISWQTPPVLEEWTAIFHEFNAKHDDFKFTVTGSVTGFDGSGTGREKFISNSGRIVIEPQDWVFAYDKKVSNQATPDGWTVKWKVAPMFVDEYISPEIKYIAREHETILAQGLKNTKHTLELVADDQKPAIHAIRVYTPPYSLGKPND